jgi:hypothetical protein
VMPSPAKPAEEPDAKAHTKGDARSRHKQPRGTSTILATLRWALHRQPKDRRLARRPPPGRPVQSQLSCPARSPFPGRWFSGFPPPWRADA